jgi:hypothetical protein
MIFHTDRSFSIMLGSFAIENYYTEKAVTTQVITAFNP